MKLLRTNTSTTDFNNVSQSNKSVRTRAHTHPEHNNTTRRLPLRSALLPVLASTAAFPLRRLGLLVNMAAAGAASQQHRRGSGSTSLLKLGMAGDTMLGRCVAEVIFQSRQPDAPPDAERESLPFFHRAQQRGLSTPAPAEGATVLFDDEVMEIVRSEADLMFLNLECCISTSTQRWPNPYKPFFFRAPPVAIEDLKALRVDAVTLANNHALDYSEQGLLDTLDHLKAGGIQLTGAGRNVEEARRPVILSHHGVKIGIIGFTDHPAEFAATNNRPGVAYADLNEGGGGSVPQWVGEEIRRLKDEDYCDVVIVSPHWGPNMQVTPLPYVQKAARELRVLGADVIAGHSAHCFQGAWAEGATLFDMGDFIDDYAVDPEARNDLGLFFLLSIEVATKKPVRVEAIPLKLDFCVSRRVRSGVDYDFIRRRFTHQCAKLGTAVHETADGRLYFDLP